eukprot:481567_1
MPESIMKSIIFLLAVAESYDMSQYRDKSKILCNEWEDLNNWNTTADIEITYRPLLCPNIIAPCLYSPKVTNNTAQLAISTKGYTDIELIWDMRSFVSYDTSYTVQGIWPTITGTYSCDGTNNGLTEFFIIDWKEEIGYGAGTAPNIASTPTTYGTIYHQKFLNQYFKLPQTCNNKQSILIHIEILGGSVSGYATYGADFSIDNFCVYGNSQTTDQPTLAPNIATPTPTTDTPTTSNPITTQPISSQPNTAYPTSQPTTSDSTAPTHSPIDYKFCTDYRQNGNIGQGLFMRNNRAISGEKEYEKLCELCVCNEENTVAICDTVHDLMSNLSNDVKQSFMETCGFENECSFEKVGLKVSKDKIEECGCDIFECEPLANNGNVFATCMYLPIIIVSLILE